MRLVDRRLSGEPGECQCVAGAVRPAQLLHPANGFDALSKLRAFRKCASCLTIDHPSAPLLPSPILVGCRGVQRDADESVALVGPAVDPSLVSPTREAKAYLAGRTVAGGWAVKPAATASNAPSGPVPGGAACDLVKLRPLMQRGTGRADVVVALIDGPVAQGHPALSGANIREIESGRGNCGESDNAACFHGTFIAGILSAGRGTAAPAICPGCTLVVRPIFSAAERRFRGVPSATPQDLAAALIECIDAGARVVNLSASLAYASPQHERDLHDVLDHAAAGGSL